VLLCSLEIAWVTRVGRRMSRARHVASPNAFGDMRGLPNPTYSTFHRFPNYAVTYQQAVHNYILVILLPSTFRPVARMQPPGAVLKFKLLRTPGTV
jgi:hypothetical protein